MTVIEDATPYVGGGLSFMRYSFVAVEAKMLLFNKNPP